MNSRIGKCVPSLPVEFKCFDGKCVHMSGSIHTSGLMHCEH